MEASARPFLSLTVERGLMWCIQFVERNGKGDYTAQFCLKDESCTCRVTHVGIQGLVERADELGLLKNAEQRARFLRLCDQCLGRWMNQARFQKTGGCS